MQQRYSTGSRDDVMRIMELIATMRHDEEVRTKRHARKTQELKEYIESNTRSDITETKKK
jgi:hypothetical protein